MKKTFLSMFLMSFGVMGTAIAQNQDQGADQSSANMGKSMTVTGCLQPGTEPNSFVLFNVIPSDMNQQSSSRQQTTHERTQTSRTYDDQGQMRSETRRDYDQTRNQDQTADPESRIQDESQMAEPSEMARTETSYTLIPDGRVDFSKFVGKKVEVTGKMSEMTSRTQQSSRATTPAGQESSIHSSTEVSGQPQFRVSSIRQISQSCR